MHGDVKMSQEQQKIFALMEHAADLQKIAETQLQSVNTAVQRLETKTSQTLTAEVRHQISASMAGAAEKMKAAATSAQEAQVAMNATRREFSHGLTWQITFTGISFFLAVAGGLFAFTEYQVRELRSIRQEINAASDELSKIPQVLQVQGEKGYWVVIDRRAETLRLKSGVTVARLPAK